MTTLFSNGMSRTPGSPTTTSCAYTPKTARRCWRRRQITGKTLLTMGGPGGFVTVVPTYYRPDPAFLKAVLDPTRRLVFGGGSNLPAGLGGQVRREAGRIGRRRPPSGSSRSIERQAQPRRFAVGGGGIPHLQQEWCDNAAAAEADQHRHGAKSRIRCRMHSECAVNGAEFRRDRRCAGGNFRSLAVDGAGCADRNGVQRNRVHHGESAGTESFEACERSQQLHGRQLGAGRERSTSRARLICPITRRRPLRRPNAAARAWLSDVSQVSFSNVFVDWGDGTVVPLAAPPVGQNVTNWDPSQPLELPSNGPSPMEHAYHSLGEFTVRVYQISNDDLQHVSESAISSSVDGPTTPFLQTALLSKMTSSGGLSKSGLTVSGVQSSFQQLLGQSGGNSAASQAASDAYMLYCHTGGHRTCRGSGRGWSLASEEHRRSGLWGVRHLGIQDFGGQSFRTWRSVGQDGATVGRNANTSDDRVCKRTRERRAAKARLSCCPFAKRSPSRWRFAAPATTALTRRRQFSITAKGRFA